MRTPHGRSTGIWFVAAGFIGAVAVVLHLLRSEIGGGHTAAPLTVAAYVCTALTAAAIYHGIMVAADEQDAATRRRSRTSAAVATEPVATERADEAAETP